MTDSKLAKQIALPRRGLFRTDVEARRDVIALHGKSMKRKAKKAKKR